MARIESIIDDLTGATLNEAVDPTVITVDGTKYSLDLGSASKERLIKWLSGEGSIVNTPRATSAKASSKKGKAASDDAAKARTWARLSGFTMKNGKPVGEKGVLAAEVIEAWEAEGRPEPTA